MVPSVPNPVVLPQSTDLTSDPCHFNSPQLEFHYLLFGTPLKMPQELGPPSALRLHSLILLSTCLLPAPEQLDVQDTGSILY